MKGQPLEWRDGRLRILDQTRLPHRQVWLEMDGYRDVAVAIKEMRIRGAPAIGVAAAYGIALGARDIAAGDREDFLKELDGVCREMAATRPTAVNLFRSVARMKATAVGEKDVLQTRKALRAEAERIHQEEVEASRRLSFLGAELLNDGDTVLTHCNTGALAAPGYGTAGGVVLAAWEQGKKIKVLADETRPYLQGARLTCWELKQAGIPCTLITDSMAGYFLGQGKVNCVLVGADRIAASGDVANKIGTYGLAVLAAENGVPFYVAAPVSTIDLSTPSGDKINIEQRDPREVTHFQGRRVAPAGVEAANPAFDVTPHTYVSAIITERGIAREPYVTRLKALLSPSLRGA
ncbi:MAG: translation initiation factor, aIF-2BI family [Dehalococcoidia bacterium]|nr:translation initiation factor, aIF-2BI family [Dehalococcoidia bacterium]